MTYPPAPDDDVDRRRRGGHDVPAGMPRWVKVFAAIGVVLVVLLLVGLLLGGDHGPGRHMGDAGGGRTSATLADSGGGPLAAARARR